MRPMVKAFFLPFTIWEGFLAVFMLLGSSDVTGSLIVFAIFTPIGAAGIALCMFLGRELCSLFEDPAKGELTAIIVGAVLGGATPILAGYAAMIKTGGFEAAAGAAMGLFAAAPTAFVAGVAAAMSAKASKRLPSSEVCHDDAE